MLGFWFVNKQSDEIHTDNAYVNAEVINISSQINGRIAEVYIKSHESVNQGQPLFKIDDTQLRLEIDALSDELAINREQRLTLVQKSAKQAQYIKQQVALLPAFDAEIDHTQKELNRFNTLNQKEFTSLTTVDALHLKLAQQTSERASHTYYIEALNKELSILTSEINVLDKQYQRLQSAIKLVKHQQDNTLVLAPSKGTLSRLLIRRGEYIEAGDHIAHLVIHNSFWIQANIKESDLAYIKEKQPVNITLDAFPNIIMKGQIKHISPATGSTFSKVKPDHATGNFVRIIQKIPVEISFSDISKSPVNIRAGLSAHVSVDIRAVNNG